MLVYISLKVSRPGSNRRRSIQLTSIGSIYYGKMKSITICIAVLVSSNGVCNIQTQPLMVQAFSSNHCNHVNYPSLARRSSYLAIPRTSTSIKMATDPTNAIQHQKDQEQSHHRRFFLRSLTTAFVFAATTIDSLKTAKPALAMDVTTAEAVEMKTFVDPKGLFVLNVPKRFFVIRRTVKGDLPNEETGEGRRGSSIFTAGDMSKVELVAVERFPVTSLLQTAGVKATGDLSTFPSLGDSTAIATLIALRRDKDKPGQSKANLLPESVTLSPDGRSLYFQLSTEVDVQKPDLLMEQTGIGEIVRITLAKASLESGDGQMMAVFASALKQDLAGGDGIALKESVDSFRAMEQVGGNK